MRRKRAFNRGRLVSILVAGFVGYLLGSWNAAAVRSPDSSAAETVAQRFPQDWDALSAARDADEDEVTTASVVGPVADPQRALFDPQPMIRRVEVVPSPAPAATADPPQSPPATAAAAVPAPAPAVPAPRPERKVERPLSEPKATAAVAHSANRPGYMLNDAQIASIKTRLHLTPEQERMWPAVEVALRNIAFAKSREARQRAAAGIRAQIASVDPNSAEVQDLKSAAIPLIMSFNSEQKDEVRNLAHVMGLDQLASQF